MGYVDSSVADMSAYLPLLQYSTLACLLHLIQITFDDIYAIKSILSQSHELQHGIVCTNILQGMELVLVFTR